LSRRTILLAALAALLAFAWVAAPAYAVELAPPAPHSPNADAIHSSYVVMIVITFAVILIVNGALIATVVRFRERRGQEPARFSAGRGAFRPVIGVLGLVALAIFVFGVIKTNDARDLQPSGPNGLGGGQTAQVGVNGVPPISVAAQTATAAGDEQVTGAGSSDSGPLQINAIAQQWLWRFEYPGHTPSTPLFSYGELVVPVDTAVVLNVTSTDVLHSWWIPALGGQVQASPGDVVQTWFKADAVGRYAGASTMFSGTAFPAMRAWVRVVTVPEYQAYVERLGTDLTEAQGIVQEVQRRQDAQ
jgi:cytochrome c oxidase subunit 2